MQKLVLGKPNFRSRQRAEMTLFSKPHRVRRGGIPASELHSLSQYEIHIHFLVPFQVVVAWEIANFDFKLHTREITTQLSQSKNTRISTLMLNALRRSNTNFSDFNGFPILANFG